MMPQKIGNEMNVAETIVSCLEKAGISYIFGVPGEETLDILEALRKSDIRFIGTRHEQGAGFMAATCGRLTGITGVCLTTLGPGALNTMTSVAYAHLGQMPMLLISGQKPVTEVKQGNFQMVDVIDSMQTITLLSQRLVKANATSSLVFNSLYKASGHPAGPVHIELPEDIASKQVSEEVAHLDPFKICARSFAAQEDIERVAALINKSSSPLLICGQHANTPDMRKALAKFVDTSCIPFASTQMGKGAVDETHSLYRGTTAFSEGDFIHKIAEQSDLLIMVGHNESEKPPLMACCFRKNILHIHNMPPNINEVYFPDHVLVGDMAASFHSLSRKITPKTLDKSKSVRDDFLRHEERLSVSTMLFQLVEQVRDALPKKGIVTLDNGMYKIWFARHYRCYFPHTLLLDNALATMGAGLPSAIAAALIYPDRPVLAICGDGGYMMSLQELETALRLKINLTVLVLRDNHFGMIKWKQNLDGYEEYAMDFGNPDFAALAESFGAQGHKIDNVMLLGERIARCHKEGGVHVIEVPISYEANETFTTLPGSTPL